MHAAKHMDEKRVATTARVAALALTLCVASVGRSQSNAFRSGSGLVALEQAKLDVNSDALVLLVASHPDDRYLLPAVWLRHRHGARVAVLLASRGGGGQNYRGPESGDELERIRTLEAESGCATFGGEVWHLNRPDRGFRRTAAETFAEWGRDDTIAQIARLLRVIRPDVVMSTHHREETHGHDLALAEALPLAVAMAADPSAAIALPTHEVRGLFLGATSDPGAAAAVTIDADAIEPVRGQAYRRIAHDILLQHHLSPGMPGPMETIFETQMRFVSLPAGRSAASPSLFANVPTLFDGIVREEASRSLRAAIDACNRGDGDAVDAAVSLVRLLESVEVTAGSDASRRRERRLEAARELLLQANRIQVEVAPRPGATAVPGEELQLDLVVRVGGKRRVLGMRAHAESGAARVETTGGEDSDATIEAGGSLRTIATYSVPLEQDAGPDATDARFRRDRYTAPVRLRVSMTVEGIEVSRHVDVPVELAPPVRLTVVPRMLLLPLSRGEVRFAVKAERNSVFPVQGKLELRAPAGYRVEGPRTEVTLDAARNDVFEFSLRGPQDRRSGVDRVRISLGGNVVVLPVHRIDAEVPKSLRIGVVRSLDDALTSAIGAGGFGLQWFGLNDLDLAVGDLDGLDTVVVDVRALRDRPQARQSFRRLLEFSAKPGKRLLVLYHKDVEYDPPGEGFRGAPFQPFHIGKERVTRADAPIRLLAPTHRLLTAPNAIRAEDWDGWEQERGLYFPSVYAADYEEIVECGDPGMPRLRSALLYARHGEGEFVYCALSLWRQLKKLHPGSVRLLANMLTPTPASVTR
jgi:LmbE family N-acetylglucosaminyl deacetylase